MPQQVHVRGEGGYTFLMDLPLPRHIKARVDKGYLHVVDDVGAEVEQERKKPAVNDPKSDWVGWAVWKSRHDERPVAADDADGMTKQDLIEQFG